MSFKSQWNLNHSYLTECDPWKLIRIRLFGDFISQVRAPLAPTFQQPSHSQTPLSLQRLWFLPLYVPPYSLPSQFLVPFSSLSSAMPQIPLPIPLAFVVSPPALPLFPSPPPGLHLSTMHWPQSCQRQLQPFPQTHQVSYGNCNST